LSLQLLDDGLEVVQKRVELLTGLLEDVVEDGLGEIEGKVVEVLHKPLKVKEQELFLAIRLTLPDLRALFVHKLDLRLVLLNGVLSVLVVTFPRNNSLASSL